MGLSRRELAARAGMTLTEVAYLESYPATVSFEDCLRLLASVPVGRAGFCADGEVMVLPCAVPKLARWF
jgi:hypothetical protein